MNAGKASLGGVAGRIIIIFVILYISCTYFNVNAHYVVCLK